MIMKDSKVYEVGYNYNGRYFYMLVVCNSLLDAYNSAMQRIILKHSIYCDIVSIKLIDN